MLVCEGELYQAKQCDGDECYCANPQTGLLLSDILVTMVTVMSIIVLIHKQVCYFLIV